METKTVVRIWLHRTGVGVGKWFIVVYKYRLFLLLITWVSIKVKNSPMDKKTWRIYEEALFEIHSLTLCKCFFFLHVTWNENQSQFDAYRYHQQKLLKCICSDWTKRGCLSSGLHLQLEREWNSLEKRGPLFFFLHSTPKIRFHWNMSQRNRHWVAFIRD